ncbi:nucleotidyltransferase [Azoarcus sp. DD4]|uniref:nucleotidyltransferase n=1 Tax=Azoarcus sp. DD4 TaxID=2027405 RepID=UPI001F0DF7C6|nr:nucleotidyltransferase [Azoarcus sp. DD4]
MTLTKSADLVLQAERTRPARLTESLESIAALRNDGLTRSAERDLLLAYSPWARALNDANLHITVRPEEIAAAAEAYREVAGLLVAKLDWPNDTIRILPQGSASTQTLIRSPFGGEKFDIDAVCQVDISRVAAQDPMGFFQSVGDALEELEAEAKKRCWNIPFPNRPFYLEFTPSVPLNNVPQYTMESMAPRYRAAFAYRATALAVVDTPTERWKTSNPAGMTKWIDDTAKRPLIRQVSLETAVLREAKAEVAPVLEQAVEITDTLRVAIRLFKRHRDMCVRRGIIAGEAKPISIIIVTLLTSCYEGLADLGRVYAHPVELLDDLASLLPHLVLKLEDQYRVDNATVEGENFAEKWNHDGGTRYRAFVAWCKALSADLKTILALTEPQEISTRVREVFGIPAPTTDGTGLSSARYPAPPPTRPGRGLA